MKDGNKRQFWWNMIWWSLLATALPIAIGFAFSFADSFFSMRASFGSGTFDQEAIDRTLSRGMLSIGIGALGSFSGFLMLLFVLVRFFTLPKPH